MKCLFNTGVESKLTVGKDYPILAIHDEVFAVIDDTGEEETYGQIRFADTSKKYVVLEHLTLPHRGFRFWSTNGKNNTHSAKGELWYKVILYTDSTKIATDHSQTINTEVLPTSSELEEYWKNHIANGN